MKRAVRVGIVALAVASGAPCQALEPQVNYQLQCMGCHHRDGAGENGRVPSIRRTLVQFSRFPEGRDYLLRVPGVAQAALSDQELAALLNWMTRNLSDVPLPQNFVEFTPAEVHAARREPLAAVAAERARLLEHLAGQP